MSARRLYAFLLSLLLMPFSLPALALQETGVTADLQQAIRDGREVAFIVRFSERVDLRAFHAQGQGRERALAALLVALHDRADASQGAALELLRGSGASRLVQLWAVNALAATAPANTIPRLTALPGVEAIALDSTVSAPAPSPATTTSVTTEWNLDAVRAPELWGQGYTGNGVVVASMDTGVDADHPDLAARWRGGSNSWFDPHGEHAAPYDYSGHGTQVMGVLVGGDAGGSAIGVAPGAQWIAVKLYSDSGSARLSDIHLGFQWLLDPDGDPATDDAPQVVNNSWGFADLANQCYLEFEPDLEVLKAAGIAVVFSAGNGGPAASTSESPANNPAGLAVGAVDSTQTVASTSSRGPSACSGGLYPQLVAPGVYVKSADLTFGGLFPDAYAYVSGTSVAAPHVAGVVALLREAFPAASVADLEQALKDAAVDVDTAGLDNASGYGLVDAVVAAQRLGAIPPPPCNDTDGDGFYAEPNCGTLPDCNDSDAGINPAACDIKRDGIDQDCDGQDRTSGKSCPTSGGGDGGGGVEGKGNTCSDGIDNDGDGFIDCLDSDCSRNKACRVR